MLYDSLYLKFPAEANPQRKRPSTGGGRGLGGGGEMVSLASGCRVSSGGDETSLHLIVVAFV